MGGFKNLETQNAFRANYFVLMIEKILLCCRMMKQDCLRESCFIDNHEVRIRDYLVANYLENVKARIRTGLDKLKLGFIIEAPENYNVKTNTYKGRVDIKVVNDNWFRNPNDYYTIECKRIDGTTHLNREFTVDGIARFVVEPVQYPSYRKKNVMFGFMVKQINIDANAAAINSIQEGLDCTIQQCFSKLSETQGEFCVYSSKYLVMGNTLELQHLFYNFSSIIETKITRR